MRCLGIVNDKCNFAKLGVIGGLGPKTGFDFCFSINNKFKEITGSQPDINLINLPVSNEIEKEIISGRESPSMLALLEGAVEQLNKSDVDFIAIPCNTVHVFIDRLRAISKKPIISIIEQTAKECKKRKVRKVGLLASETTIKTRLHADKLSENKIKILLPNKAEQQKINEIIIMIINNKANKEDRIFLSNLIEKFAKEGAEAVILGCTDLPILISQKDSGLPLINTLRVLEDFIVSTMIGGENGAK